MLRPLVSAFLLLVFIVSIGGYFPLFKIEQWQLRREIKRHLKANVPQNELHRIEAGHAHDWEREGEEFRIGDEMFDVVRTDTIDGKVWYYCINDREERSLFIKLDQMVQDEMDHGNLPARHHANSLIKVLCGLTYLPGKTMSLLISCCTVKSTCADVVQYPSDFSQDILHPPRC